MLRAICDMNHAAYTNCLRYSKQYRKVIPLCILYRVPTKQWQRSNSTVSFRKQLKDEARARKAQGDQHRNRSLESNVNSEWELTVGIEIHAQLNSDRKLFSGELMLKSI